MSVVRGGEEGRAELLAPHASALSVVVYGWLYAGDI